MNFENNIGFICRTENEWYECQKILFSKNIYWLSNKISTNKTKDILKTKDIYPMLILINSKEKTTYLTYIPLESWLMLKETKPNFLNHNVPYKSTIDKFLINGNPIHHTLYEAKLLIRKYKLEKINGL